MRPFHCKRTSLQLKTDSTNKGFEKGYDAWQHGLPLKQRFMFVDDEKSVSL